MNMMRAPALILLLTGCVYTIDSAIPAGQETSEPGLIGTWTAQSDTASVRAERGGGYRVSLTGDSATIHFAARAMRIDGQVLLELTPLLGEDGNEDGWPMAYSHLVLDVRG